MSLVVIKVGGSLCGSQRLERLLEMLVEFEHHRLVIVAGGGPFADAVRQVQAMMPFDDDLAHRLALDAMTHLAEVFATRHARLILAASFDDIANAHREGKVPIWHPTELRSGHPDIAEGWEVTSDSLALWLATRLQAEHLVLVKSVDAPEGATSAALVGTGIVDAAFPGYASRYGGRITIAGPALDARLRSVINQEHVRSEAL